MAETRQRKPKVNTPESELAEVMAQEGVTEDQVQEEAPEAPEQVPELEEVEERSEAEIAREGRMPVAATSELDDANDAITVPEDFDVVAVETVSERDKRTRVLAGETPVTYRGIIEFSPIRMGAVKGPDGTSAIKRVEFFFNDPHVFWWLISRASREAPDLMHSDVARAEAVILDPQSMVIWQDRNANEDN